MLGMFRFLVFLLIHVELQMPTWCFMEPTNESISVLWLLVTTSQQTKVYQYYSTPGLNRWHVSHHQDARAMMNFRRVVEFKPPGKGTSITAHAQRNKLKQNLTPQLTRKLKQDLAHEMKNTAPPRHTTEKDDCGLSMPRDWHLGKSHIL